MHQYGSLRVPQTLKKCEALIEVFKFIRYISKKKLHACTYSTVRFTLRFVNLFVEISRVCGALLLNHKKDQPRFHKYVNKKVINGKERFVMTTICKLTVVNYPWVSNKVHKKMKEVFCSKGQLISEWNFSVLKFSKNATKKL